MPQFIAGNWRRALWPLLVLGFLAVAYLLAKAVTPPSFLVDLMQGEKPLSTDVQWARAALFFAFLIGEVLLTMLFTGLPEEIQSGPLQYKRKSSDDREQIATVKAELERHTDLIATAVTVDQGLSARLRDLDETTMSIVQSIDGLRRDVEELEAKSNQASMDNLQLSLHDLEAKVEVLRATYANTAGPQGPDQP